MHSLIAPGKLCVGALAIAAVLASAPISRASAKEIFLFGDVGRFPVVASLERDGTKLDGWYLYVSQGKQILIDGTLTGDGRFQLTEKAGAGQTAAFAGMVHGADWTGTWLKTGARAPLAVALHENRDRLADLSARFRCTVKVTDKPSGMILSHELQLRIDRGTVSNLSMSRTTNAPGGDDEQTCSIGSSDLKAEPAKTGLLLRSKEDVETGPDAQHCTIHILADARTLYVKVGNTDETNNDCRQAGETMYCSPRAFWSDMVIDRTSGACRSVQ